jgi:hypothetical protein
MHALLGLLAIVTVALAAPSDDIQPITIHPEHYAVAWTVELEDPATVCRARAWIGRMGEQPIFTLFAAELDEEVPPTAEGQAPLYGLPPGAYDVHVENDGCWWQFNLVARWSAAFGKPGNWRI